MANLYRFYNQRVRSNFAFTCADPQPDDGAPAEITFTCPAGLPPVAGAELFRTPYLGAGGQPYLLAYPVEAGYRLRFPGIAAFSLQGGDLRAAPEPALVGAEASPDTGSVSLETAFVSLVMALYLELRALRCLHAAALALPAAGGQRCAVAFLADSGRGKSTFAHACLAAGAQLLSDDILPVADAGVGAFNALPGYPRLRLWPQQASALGLLDPAAGLPAAKLRLPLPAAWFHDAPLPLAGLFLLQRDDDPALAAPRLERLAGHEALLALLRYSFLPRLSAALGLNAARLDFFTRLAAAVPIRRLVYPAGLPRLPEAVELVINAV